MVPRSVTLGIIKLGLVRDLKGQTTIAVRRSNRRLTLEAPHGQDVTGQ